MRLLLVEDEEKTSSYLTRALGRAAAYWRRCTPCAPPERGEKYH